MTMQATLDWSHNLLSEAAAALFRRLSVFAGGFTLEAAEVVGAAGQTGSEEVLELLGRLVEQSLVGVRTAPEGLRYGMLEPVRQYAFERLDESGGAAETCRRHAEHFVALAEAAKPELLGPKAVAWLDRLEKEHDNLREALRWARETVEVEIGLRLSGALCWFWWRRGYLAEGRSWAEGFLSESADGVRPASGPVRAGALYGAGELAFAQGDLARATDLFEEGLALYRELSDEVGVAILLVELGQVARARGDHDRAASLSEEGLALGRRLGERAVTAIALNTLGHIERHRGNAERAIAHYEEGLALFREGEDEWGGAYSLVSLAVAALERGDLHRASDLGQESFSLYEKQGDKAGMALALINLGDVARQRGEEERAAALYNDALSLHRELGNERGVARALDRLSRTS
jgi:tetratricopeptide (TPR) repeat protein